MKENTEWLIALAKHPLARRAARAALLLLAGAALEQVTRLGVLPPELVAELHRALALLKL